MGRENQDFCSEPGSADLDLDKAVSHALLLLESKSSSLYSLEYGLQKWREARILLFPETQDQRDFWPELGQHTGLYRTGLPIPSFLLAIPFRKSSSVPV